MDDALLVALGFLEPFDAVGFALTSRAHLDLFRTYLERYVRRLGLADAVHWSARRIVSVDMFPRQTRMNRARFFARVRKEPRLPRDVREAVLLGLGDAAAEAHAYVCINSPPPFALDGDVAMLMRAMDGAHAPRSVTLPAGVELWRPSRGVSPRRGAVEFEGTAVLWWHPEVGGSNSLHGVAVNGALYPTRDWRAGTLVQLQHAARDFFELAERCPGCRAAWHLYPCDDCAICAHFARRPKTFAGGAVLKRARDEAMRKRLKSL